MGYTVDVDYAPAYELLVSLRAYIQQKDHSTLQLGAKWVSHVRQQLRPEFAEALAAEKEPWGPAMFPLLIWQSPHKREAAAFVNWLGALSVGEIYERLAPYLPESGQGLPRDLGAGRDWYARVLATWHDQYFRGVDPVILAGLERDAVDKRALLQSAAPDEVVELATGGVSLEPAPEIERVLLVPQYHQNPLNLFALGHRLALFLYAADAVTPAAGQPSPALLRLTRALADESRLRMLHYLGGDERSFKEIVQWSGLAQSTVHHHLVVLRAAGLVRVRFSYDVPRYGLRPTAVQEVSHRLSAFLDPTGAA
ncbi:MAG: helix-turn-helix transcriptional regulator [Chloroflexi bacterium]|nr:helix-turn-helix transcriptional regulator [Chloroflexota bacterium]